MRTVSFRNVDTSKTWAILLLLPLTSGSSFGEARNQVSIERERGIGPGRSGSREPQEPLGYLLGNSPGKPGVCTEAENLEIKIFFLAGREVNS